MGVMRFEIRPPSLLSEWPEVYRAYVSGADGRVFPTRVEITRGTTVTSEPHPGSDPDLPVLLPDESELSGTGSIIPVMAVKRQIADSGFLNVAFPVEGFGRPVLRTGSLCERENVYSLAVELARGQLSQLRDQVAAWNGASILLPDEFEQLRSEAHQVFSQAATLQHSDPDAAAEKAIECLHLTLKGADIATQTHTAWSLGRFREQRASSPAALGCGLGWAAPDETTKKHLLDCATALNIPVRWRQIEPEEGLYDWDVCDAQVEFGSEKNFLMFGGPLLDFAVDGLPKWLSNWVDDFFNLQSFVSDFVETAVSRYVGAIRHWEVSARANTGGAFGGDAELDEETRLALAARTLDVARQVDEEIQLLIRIDEPWSAYQSRGRHQLSAMQFADALQRMGTGVAAVNLDLAIGYRKRGSNSRGPSEVAHLLNHWSLLGLPLYVTLAVPSASGPDANLLRPSSEDETEPHVWKQKWNEFGQAAWIDEYLPLIMSNPQVVGVFWSHLNDADPHDYPHAGLIDSDGNPKAAFRSFCQQKHGIWLGDTAYHPL